jgi:hypothetical protein
MRHDLRKFTLVRHQDETGVSGTGLVAWGVLFPDGRVATRWNAEMAQTCAWDNLSHVVAVHGHGGATEVRWADDESAVDRLAKIAEAHSKDVGPGGLTSGDCAECSWSWPCPTYVWATSDRDPVIDCWNPADDGPPAEEAAG